MKISIQLATSENNIKKGAIYYVEHPNEFNKLTSLYECWFSPQTLLELINYYATLDRADEGRKQEVTRVNMVREVQE